jgi:hypothetical protein
MEKVMNNLNNPPTEQIKNSINSLIGEYEESHILLNDQIEAVVNHDILSLNHLIEKQVKAYEKLSSSEKKFRTQLQAFQNYSSAPSPKTLQEILQDIGEPSQTLNKLRNRLHIQVEKTEKLRAQLIDLLEFAQQQNSDLFKAICSINDEKTEGYDADGEKQHHTGSMAIDQKA